MREFDFFDLNLTLGRPRIPKLRVETDAAVMKADLAAVGISGGLVRHMLSVEWHPTEGNAELSRTLEHTPAFEPVWAVLPHWTGEFPPPDDLARDMAANRVRAVIMYPQLHGFHVRPSVTGPLLDMLAAKRVLLLLPFAEADLGVVETIARNHPTLAVVVSDTPYSFARELYAVFTACPNVFVEISGYMVHRGIEDIVNRFGEERLVFGSRYPSYNPGCAVAAVLYARIPDDAKAAIAGRNAKSLIAKAVLT